MNLPPNHFSFEANCYDSLRRGFGDRGYDLTKAFSDRKTRHRHNNGLEEEIWILRRYLFTLASENILNYPLSLQNHESPDFIGTYQGLLGTFGGRYRHGASGGPNTRSHTPERDLTADVLAALIRKRKKIKKHYKPTTKIDVVIYANSNAQRLTYETDYFKILQRNPEDTG